MQLEDRATGARQFAGWFYLFILIGAMMVVQVFPLTADERDARSSRTSLAGPPLSPAADRPALAKSAEIALPEVDPVPPTLVDDGARENIPRSGDRPGTATPPAPTPIWYLADGQQVMDLEFDLATQDDLRSGLAVNKPLRVDGSAVGEVAITINGSSRLYISASDLRRVLPPELAGRLAAESQFVAFDTLRESGIVIRYDPVADALNITT